MKTWKAGLIFVFCLPLFFSCGREASPGANPENTEETMALQALEEFRFREGFRSGMGVRESALLESLGRLEDSLCAAFQDLEYHHALGLLSMEEVLEGLELMKSPVTDAGSARVVKGLEAYVAERFDEAVELLCYDPATEVPVARSYYYLACLLRSGRYDASDLRSYALLEPAFRNFGPYYTHLWKTMKEGEGNYTLETAGAVIEKCLLLSGEPSAKAEAAAELARLYRE